MNKLIFKTILIVSLISVITKFLLLIMKAKGILTFGYLWPNLVGPFWILGTFFGFLCFWRSIWKPSAIRDLKQKMYWIFLFEIIAATEYGINSFIKDQIVDTRYIIERTGTDNTVDTVCYNLPSDCVFSLSFSGKISNLKVETKWNDELILGEDISKFRILEYGPRRKVRK